MLESYQTLEVRRQALLKSIVQIGPFLMATPTWLKVRCGNPRCECATDREKRHEKLHLNSDILTYPSSKFSAFLILRRDLGYAKMQP